MSTAYTNVLIAAIRTAIEKNSITVLDPLGLKQMTLDSLSNANVGNEKDLEMIYLMSLIVKSYSEVR